MEMLLLKIFYHAHCRSICSDFKVIVILLGLQTEDTKYCCFLCYLDSPARDKNYTVTVWTKSDSFESGQRNVAEDLLVDTKNVKAIVRNGKVFGHQKQLSQNSSKQKSKKGFS